MHHLKEGDITLSCVPSGVELKLWSFVNHPAISKSCMRIGRLDYGSIVALSDIESGGGQNPAYLASGYNMMVRYR